MLSLPGSLWRDNLLFGDVFRNALWGAVPAEQTHDIARIERFSGPAYDLKRETGGDAERMNEEQRRNGAAVVWVGRNTL